MQPSIRPRCSSAITYHKNTMKRSFSLRPFLPLLKLSTALLLAASLTLVGQSACFGQRLMSSQTVQRLGLEQAWQRQLRVADGASSIVDQKLHVHTDRPIEYVELVEKTDEGEGEVFFRINVQQQGSNGKPIGEEEAKRLARREQRFMARTKIPTEITKRSVPRIYLYTLANNGTVECRDAETGAPVWLSQHGTPSLGYGGLGVDNEYLTFTNGANIIQIDVLNGEPMVTDRTKNTPLYGSMIAGDYVVYPTVRDGIAGEPLRDITEVGFSDIVQGLANHMPSKSPHSALIAWGTDAGYVYVMELSGKRNMQFRLDTDGVVSGQPVSAQGNRFFFASSVGQVYCLRATRSGDVVWNRPYGVPFFKPGYLFDDAAFFVSDYGQLFALEQNNGISRWESSVGGIDRVLGGLGQHLYVRKTDQSFAVIDSKTGELVLSDPGLRVGKMLVNTVTNRFYLVSNQGSVQCLRPAGSKLPTLVEFKDSADESKKKPEFTKPPVNNTDPFGLSTPAPAKPMANPTDPFGAPMDDPFGAPAGGDDKDPFGDADPFGN